ncbi:MAG: ATP-binding protein [Gemmatimonadota bacterium]
MRISLEIDAPEAVVLADPVELQQVFMNLATNGYLALEDGAGDLTFGLEVRAGEAVVEVRDTGVGMTEDTLARALDPFFTTRGTEGGTGLGLSSVHGIVRSLGGSLEIQSAPGEGTSVVARLPLASTTPPPSPGPSGGELRSEPLDRPPTGKGQGRALRSSAHLLLVDDDPAVLRVTARILDRRGYQVTTAEGARAAVELLAEEGVRFDLLLTDQTMPEFTGLEVIRRCREAGRNLPVVLMSGYLPDDVRGEADRFGATLLPKPFDRGELIRSVEDALAAGQESSSGD